MKNLIWIAVCAVAFSSLTSGQSQSAFESFMSRNRELFPNIGSFGSQESGGLRSNFGRSFPLTSNFASEQAPPPYITSNSHIQAFNPPPGATTVSGPNFATFTSSPSTGAAFQSFMSQSSPSFQAQPFQNFQSQPIQSFSSFSAPQQTFQNSEQSGQQQQQPPNGDSQFIQQNFGFQSGLKGQGAAPGEAKFVFMLPSESPQGATLRKVVRGENGIEKEIFYVPMQNYVPPTVYNYQTVHQIPTKPGQSSNQ